MFETLHAIHFGTIAMAVAINSISVGLGESLTSYAALKAINIQPSAYNEIKTTALYGMALIETAAVIGLVISLMMLTQPSTYINMFYGHLGELGIGFAICFTGFVASLGATFAAQQACYSIARQPFFHTKIQGLMFLTQAIMQTPIFFGFLVALIIRAQVSHAASLPDSLRLIAAGLSVGLGSIGPALGLSLFAEQACKAVGINRHSHGKIFSFTIPSQGIIESPLIFALLVSIMILYKTLPSAPNEALLVAISCLAAAFTMGVSTIGTGISLGRVAGKTCAMIALYPEQYPALFRTSLISQALIETTVIYALLVSIWLILG